jgi:mRNA-degrading endonuclease toxin of MazEF toxin-antitoxin module
VLLSADAGLPKDSVANVSQIITIDRSFLAEKYGCLKKQKLISNPMWTGD